MDYVLKYMPARWWGTHKQSISKWTQCRRLMEIIFEEEINYPDKKYIVLTDPRKHIEHFRGIGKNIHRKNGFIDSSTLWKWYREVGTPQKRCDEEPLNGKS